MRPLMTAQDVDWSAQDCICTVDANPAAKSVARPVESTCLLYRWVLPMKLASKTCQALDTSEGAPA